MADIFVSYARADRSRAESLARALERTGWSVWWDREIPPGRSFDEVIEEALALARCVIVLWSAASVTSEWVKTEASEAAQRRVLVPILAGGARIPLEFRRIQAAAIDDWRDLESNPGWRQLCDAVASLVESKGARPVPLAIPVRRVPWAWGLAGGVAFALLAAGGAVSMRWSRAAPATAAVPDERAPAVVGAVATPSEPTPRPRREPETRKAAAPLVVEPRATPIELPPPIQTTMVKAAVPQLVREARLETTPASFDVTLYDGVFRNQPGRLSLSPDGVRFNEEGGHGFELSCGSLRRVATATMIADSEQRLLELTSDGRAYRVRAADRGARDSLRAAIDRMCKR